ncbi:MAG: sulfurase [Methylophaga sp.]|nr:MAG: sulfurase [Methylophaga sp.]
MTGKILKILLAENAGDVLVAYPSAKLEAGKGIVGDRYYSAQGTFSEKLKGSPASEVTLIDQQHIDTFNSTTGLNYSNADFRRNIVTDNIDLNALVDKEFRIGNTRLKGIILCEPCAYLAKILGQEVMIHMTHKAGLRAQIISSGTIYLADMIS